MLQYDQRKMPTRNMKHRDER